MFGTYTCKVAQQTRRQGLLGLLGLLVNTRRSQCILYTDLPRDSPLVQLIMELWRCNKQPVFPDCASDVSAACQLSSTKLKKESVGVLGMTASRSKLTLAVGESYRRVCQSLANYGLLAEELNDQSIHILLSQMALPLKTSPSRPPGLRYVTAAQVRRTSAV